MTITQADVARKAKVALILRAGIQRALSTGDVDLGDGNAKQLEAYWTRGKGLARWIGHPHPWTRLRNLLRKYVGPGRAERLASHYFHIATGMWPGERKGTNPLGPG